MFLKNIFILCFKKSKNIFGFKLSNIFLKKNKNLFLKTINKQAYPYCFLWKVLLDSETGPRTGHSSPFAHHFVIFLQSSLWEKATATHSYPLLWFRIDGSFSISVQLHHLLMNWSNRVFNPNYSQEHDISLNFQM